MIRRPANCAESARWVSSFFGNDHASAFLIQAMKNTWTSDASDAAQLAAAVVQQGVDKRVPS